MPVLSAHIVPHPPLIVPSVGHGREKEIQQTIDSYKKAAEIIASQKPDTIIIITPHSVMYSDYIHISPSPGQSAHGSFAGFGASGEKVSLRYDTELIDKICEIAGRESISAGTEGERDKALDHGAMVPLYFINAVYTDYTAVRISISGLPLEEHYLLGMCIQEAVRKLKRNAVIIASGDLSHKLTADGPYGFSPSGPAFDRAVTGIMKNANFKEFFGLDTDMCEKAGECGLRSFVIMSGILDKLEVKTDFGSYEGPFGVGYAVCSYTVTDEDLHRNFLEQHTKEQASKLKAIKNNEDPYVTLARLTLETYISNGRKINCPDGLPEEMLKETAGVFVSLKKQGMLRGCIGTIAPTQQNIAQEIIANAISAGTRDPRFPPVTTKELDELVYSVDVLLPSEPISDKSALDPQKYGVIVSHGYKRGLLLPCLEGVDTIEEQLSIALQKGRISPNEAYSIERFEVVRHK